jgi:hypothetical protein
MHQRPGERHLLAHALREALAALMGVVAKPKPSEEIARALLGGARINPP